MSAHKTSEALRSLRDRLATISDVNAARKTLNWDRQTYMPEGGVASRAEQLATLSRLVHEMLVAEKTSELLLNALEQAESGSEDADLLRLARREYERAAKLPNRLVDELARSTTLAQPAWERGRARSDWALSSPTYRRYCRSSGISPSVWATRIILTTPCSTSTNPGQKRHACRRCSKS